MKGTIALLSFLLLFSLSSCTSNAGNAEVDAIENPSTADNPGAKSGEPIMTFESEHFDFGNIVEGEVLEHTYSFKNTGGKALLISDVQASCGCTVPVWPREPILPGQVVTITIQFNSANKHEKVNKDVTIFSNANPVKKKLTFTAYVSAKPTK